MLRVARLLLACAWSAAAGPKEVPSLPPVVVAADAAREPVAAPPAMPAAVETPDAAAPAAAVPPAAETVSASESADAPPAVARRIDEARAAWSDKPSDEAVAAAAPAVRPDPLAVPADASEPPPLPPAPPLLSRRGAAAVTLMVVSHAHYIAIPWILHLTIPLWGRVAASAAAYAVSWSLFAAGAWLGGGALWLRLKRRWTK